MDARLNLAKIKIERLQAAYYYDLMLARLLEAAGISEAFSDYAKRSAAMPIRFETNRTDEGPVYLKNAEKKRKNNNRMKKE